MAIDTTPSTVATNALQALPFHSLIGSPLDAAIKAQAMAALTNYKFIRQLQLSAENQVHSRNETKTTFVYDENGRVIQLVVPMLTIVPIPYALKEIEIHFEEPESDTDTHLPEALSATEANPVPDKFKVIANINSGDSKYSIEYIMGHSVHSGKSDMPEGLARVLDILQSSITTGNIKATLTVSPVNQTIVAAALPSTGKFDVTVTAILKDDRGLFLSGEEVHLITGAGAGITFDPAPPQRTNHQGEATFNISGKFIDAAKINENSAAIIVSCPQHNLSVPAAVSFIGN